MPVVVIDMLLKTPLAIPLYPLVYCGTGLVFTYHVVKHSAAYFHETPITKAQPAHSVNTSMNNASESPVSQEQQPDDAPETLLSDELYRQHSISPREQEVLLELVRGAGNNELSERLFISVSTVKTHLRNIYAKFDVKNRYELLALLKHDDEALIPRSDADDTI